MPSSNDAMTNPPTNADKNQTKRLSIGDMMRAGQGLWGTNSKLTLPALCGDFAIRIDKKGQWFYQGSPIGRLQLCQLFAVCLLKEGGEYFLATPAEKGKIEVADLPFYGTVAEVQENHIAIRSSLDFWVTLDKHHPLTIYEQQQPRPVVRVRDNLDMLLSPAVFYDLAHYAIEHNQYHDKKLFVQSGGEKFMLGGAT